MEYEKALGMNSAHKYERCSKEYERAHKYARGALPIADYAHRIARYNFALCTCPKLSNRLSRLSNRLRKFVSKG